MIDDMEDFGDTAVAATESLSVAWVDPRAVFGTGDPPKLTVAEAWDHIDRGWEPTAAERAALMPPVRARRWLRRRS